MFVPLNASPEEKKPEPAKPAEPEKSAEPEKPAEPEKKKGFVCTVCGYVHDSDTLPDDFICPICHNPAEFFKPIE